MRVLKWCEERKIKIVSIKTEGEGDKKLESRQ